MKKDLIKECRTYISFMKLFERISARNKTSSKKEEEPLVETNSGDILLSIFEKLDEFEINPLNLLEYLSKHLNEQSIVFDLLHLDIVRPHSYLNI